MPDRYIPKEDVQWKDVTIHNRHVFVLPEPLADWGVFDHWEKTRFEHMEDNLRSGMVLYDVGTEQGWCNLLCASYVNPENMVLIEPTWAFWPNIKETWDRNFGVPPKATYEGLVSTKTTDTRSQLPQWPESCDAPLIANNKYQYIHDHDQRTTEITLDDLVTLTGVAPDALTIDVEGAELLVLQGGQQTLREHRPQIWVSVHPDLGVKYNGVEADEFHQFMTSCGYIGYHLGTDHEEHWYYKSKEGLR